MTLLESYIGKYMLGDEKRYFAYFKVSNIIVVDQFANLNGIHDKIVSALPHWKFDEICFIPLKDEKRTPVIKPITQSELADLENICRKSLPCALLPFPYPIWVGAPNTR